MAVEGDLEPLTWRDRLWNWFLSVRFVVYTTVVIVLLILGVIWPRTFISIPAGHHGVMYRPLGKGTVTEKIWGEGFHVIPPWDELTIYETRLQQKYIETNILSDEGLGLDVIVAVRFRADRDMLGFLHQDVGPEYYDRLILPEVRSHVREIFGQRPAHGIYSSAGDLIQELQNVTMLTRIGEAARAYVIIQEIKLVDIHLPSIVDQAIADRYRQEQLTLEYEQRLVREEKESERKRIEAKGIRDYNQIAGELTADILRWRDIDATKEIASSPSSKVILLGGGDSKTPLVFSLGTDVDKPSEAESAEAKSAEAESAEAQPSEAQPSEAQPSTQ
ncbi:MAG: prohibitin family protein [Myxococcota bacterium]